MAVHDLTSTGTSLQALKKGEVYLLEKEIDCSVDEMAQNDTAKVFYVPADVLILGAMVEVMTVEAAGGSNTIDLGLSTTGVTDETFMAAGPVDTAVTLVGDASDGNAPGTVTSTFVTTATYVTLTANHALDACKLRVKVALMDMRGDSRFDS